MPDRFSVTLNFGNVLERRFDGVLRSLGRSSCACVGPSFDNRCCDCGYMLPVKRSCWYNWNRNYAHTEYGQPVALVVPPTKKRLSGKMPRGV